MAANRYEAIKIIQIQLYGIRINSFITTSGHNVSYINQCIYLFVLTEMFRFGGVFTR